MYEAAADGTECGRGLWCYKGECVKKEIVLANLDQECQGKFYQH